MDDFTKHPGIHPVKTPKLIRDKMPTFHARDRCAAEYKIITKDDEFVDLLKAKLREEVEEFCASGDSKELADILEVVSALCVAYDYDEKEILGLKYQKREQLGGFDGRLLMTKFEWGPPPSA